MYLFGALQLYAAFSSEQALCAGQGDAGPNAGVRYKQIDKSSIQVEGTAADEIMITLAPVKRDAYRQKNEPSQHFYGRDKQKFTAKFSDLDCRKEYQLLLASTTSATDRDSPSPSHDGPLAEAVGRFAPSSYPITLKCEPPWGDVDFSHEFAAPQFNWHAGSVLSVTIAERDEDATYYVLAGDASTDNFWYQRSSRSRRGLTSSFDFSNVTTSVKIQLGKQAGTEIIKGPAYVLHVDRSSTSVAPNENIDSHKQLAAWAGVRGDNFALLQITPDLQILQVDGQKAEWRQVGSILIMTGLEPGLPYSWVATAATWAGFNMQGSFGTQIGVVPKLIGGLRTWSSSGWGWHWLAIEAQRGQVTSAHLKENGALAQLEFLDGANLLQFNALECGRTYEAEITTQFGQASVSHSFSTQPCTPPMAELLLERSGPTELFFRVTARSEHLVKLDINRGADSEPHVETLGTLKGPGSATFLAKDLKCGTGYRVAVACQLPNGNVNCSPEEQFWTDGCAGENKEPGRRNDVNNVLHGAGATGKNSGIETVSVDYSAEPPTGGLGLLDRNDWFNWTFLLAAPLILLGYLRISHAVGQARASGKLTSAFHHLLTQFIYGFRIAAITMDSDRIRFGSRVPVGVKVRNLGARGSCCVRARVRGAFPPFDLVSEAVSTVKEIGLLDSYSWTLEVSIPEGGIRRAFELSVEVLNPSAKFAEAPRHWIHQFDQKLTGLRAPEPLLPSPISTGEFEREAMVETTNVKIVAAKTKLQNALRHTTYRVGAHIATGGTGFIFEVFDVDGGKFCAKLFERQDDFARESRFYGSIKNVAGVAVCMATFGHDVIILSHIQGKHVSDVDAAQINRLMAIKVLRILVAIRGMLTDFSHNDLAGNNIIVDPQNNVYIIDWGSSSDESVISVPQQVEIRTPNRNNDVAALTLTLAMRLLKESSLDSLRTFMEHGGKPPRLGSFGWLLELQDAATPETALEKLLAWDGGNP